MINGTPCMTEYNKFILARALSWLVLVIVMSLIFGPILALLSHLWFSHWPTWATFLFNLGICYFVYIAPNTQYLREEAEILIRRMMGVKY
jgi:hypothetical protein